MEDQGKHAIIEAMAYLSHASEVLSVYFLPGGVKGEDAERVSADIRTAAQDIGFATARLDDILRRLTPRATDGASLQASTESGDANKPTGKPNNGEPRRRRLSRQVTQEVAMLDYLNDLTPKRIWNIAQNKPSLVARDPEKAYDVPRGVTHAILLARGVYKWLAVRRDLIRLKNEWRDELTRLYRQAEKMRKGTPEHRELVGRIKALEEARAAVRALCHSERWRAPDFDREAQEFLRNLTPIATDVTFEE